MSADLAALLAPTGERRLLRGSSGVNRTPRSLGEHLSEHGPLPRLAPTQIVAAAKAAGLTGRGGGAFPVWRKLEAVVGRDTVVIANGAESEPASAKDRVLLTTAPHLVLDGLALAAEAVGATRAYLYLHDGPLVEAMRRVIEERTAAHLDQLAVTIVGAPAGFVGGEESAVVAAVNGNRAVPRSTPPRVSTRGVGNRPTLVQNVETLAHLALIARHGARWFVGTGTPEAPGTMLFSVSHADSRPGVGGGAGQGAAPSHGAIAVVEAPSGSSARSVLTAAGVDPSTVRAVLVGGYYGAWIPATALDHPLSLQGLAAFGAQPGAGVLVVLTHDTCGLDYGAAVTGYLAGQSARQCGPCLNGLPALAEAMGRLSRSGEAEAAVRAERLAALVRGRGACHHPDGASGLATSTLRVFADEIAAHRAGRCQADRSGVAR